MGLSWSYPRNVRDGKSIMMTAGFPDNKFLSKKLWDLWRSCKTDLKQDGFRVSKFAEVWKISYFCDITDDNIALRDGKAVYMHDFEDKYNRWVYVYEHPIPVEDIPEELWFDED